MIKTIIASVFLLQVVGATFCNQYPLDPLACVQKITGIPCEFSFFESSCIESKSTQYGCAVNLNRMACLQQKTNINGSEAKCYFKKQCEKANEFHLRFLDCSENFSIYACVNANQNCYWENNICKKFEISIPKEIDCESTFDTAVNPNLCAQIEDLSCYSAGFEGGYLCQGVTDDQLTSFTCNTQGLSLKACISIITTGERCIILKKTQGIFKDKKCRNYQRIDEISCQNNLNREACLNIVNPTLFCVWNSRGCQDIIIDENQNCESIISVNPSVCRKVKKFCYYNEESNSCLQINDQISCNTQGLSQQACQSIKGQLCIFDSLKGCQGLNSDTLNQVRCDSFVNEDGCINITTPFQNCQWNGEACERILINQNYDCPYDSTIKLNGNVCQSVSKNGVGCKYDTKTNLCQQTSGYESCTSPYLNFHACLQISQNNACMWNEKKLRCETAVIVDQVTKCVDLKFANPAACSQITELSDGERVGCYYSDETQQCTQINDNTLKYMECSQQGLNKYGCAMITKLGQKCRWFREACTTIKSQKQIAQISCLQLQFVNAGACALVTFNKEVCKYKVEALGCVNSIDSSDTGDYCDTLGLNQYGCQQITRNPTGCYFDTINNVCLVAPNSASSKEVELAASQLLLSTAKCIGSSPTKNICIAIKTLSQNCSWNYRNQNCENQFVQLNEKCLDYNTGEKQKSIPGIVINVNSNVCASIVMNYPNYDPKSTSIPIDPLRGYCQYDGKGNCIKFQVTPCLNPCCGEIEGINAHVCSRYTTGYYCYFNEYNKCLLLTNDIVNTSQEQAVKDFYNFKEYKCSSMNKNSCWMIEWSPTQQCYWDGYVCTQIVYNNYAIYSFSTDSLSKYACQGIEGNYSKIRKYFRYFGKKQCFDYNFEISSCEMDGINSNVCLGRTPNLYCKWDQINLVCKSIDDYLQLLTCNEYQNKQACINNPYVPCAFLDSSDKCISSPQDISCYDFYQPIYLGWVNAKACANITKPGQICSFDPNAYKCQNAANQISQTCDLQGINSIGCYQNTQGNCRWDQQNLQCYEEGDQAVIANLNCSDNVNKKLCLSITNDNCEWSTVDMYCYSMKYLNQINNTSYYNAQACTSLVGNAYYFDENNNKCVILTTFNNDCTSKTLNKQACLLNTRGNKCFFDSSQVPEKKCQQFKEEQLDCTSNLSINIEVCTNIPKTCYFEQQTLTCKFQQIESSFKCSTLTFDGQYFNKISCSSISDGLTDISLDESLKICTQSPVAQNAQQCYFEKYCQWDQTTYTCSLVKIGSGSFYGGGQNYGPSCSLSTSTFTCKNIYSKAVCLQFADGCYFDLIQGGCRSYTANLYKITDCSQINSVDCIYSKTENAYCKISLATDGTDLTNNCEIDPPNIDSCQLDSNKSNTSCSSLSSETDESVCAQANDFCYFNQNCKIPESITSISCLTPGVSKALCLILNPFCDFSSGKCTKLTIPSLDSDGSNYYNVCNEVNYLITYKDEYACGLIQTSPCQYKLNSCQNAFYQQCYDLLDLTVSIMACNQCKNLTVAYDFTTQKCVEIDNLTTNCDTINTSQNCKANDCQWDNNKCHINLKRLNQSSCLQLTISIQAKWDEATNQCVSIATNQIQQITDCTILSRKACLQTSPSCWINSDTLQCDNFDQIMASCTEITNLLGQSQHCLVSNFEPCKWSNNQCLQANLTTDDCNNMNKFGCFNIQRKLNCGWSDKDKKCTQIFVYNGYGCVNYVIYGSQRYYDQVNPYVCSQMIGANVACYLDQRTNKCTSIGTLKLYCNQHVGINQLACLRLTLDKCKFDSTNYLCIPTDQNDKTCNTSLNKVACLSLPNAYCEFYQDQCNSFYLLDKTSVGAAANALPVGKVISANICQYYNSNIPNAYFIYDQVRGQCLNADKTSPSLYFALCNSISISQKVCLEKTMEYCSYQNDQCQSITLDTIRTQQNCNSAYNWKACIAIDNNCKFFNGLCSPITNTDTCLSLSIAINTYVGPQVCSQFDTPCKYSQTLFTCSVVVAPIEPCTALGLSRIACLQFTSTSFCIYDVSTNKCSSTYDNTLPCSDTNNPKKWYINTAKCYFIQSLGNYCQFKNGECFDIPQLELLLCNLPTRQTNPITCSRASTGICYYIPASNTCVVGDQGYLNIQSWSIGNSFNKQSCIWYDSLIDKVKLIWDDLKGCIELSDTDLNNIQCNSPINRLACASITNPTQYCQFNTATKLCIFIDIHIPPTNPIGTCASLTNVNRFEFCQYASDQCLYNSNSRNCFVPDLGTLQQQIINDADCFNKGMSQSLCIPTILAPCKYHPIRKLCYGGNIFCEDNTPNTCQSVLTEPCWIQANQCVGIGFDALNTINCEDAVNQLGCTSITNPQKICQFDRSTQTCNELKNLNNECSSYTYVSSNRACEYTTDVACKFDFTSKSCKEVSISDQFECDRGLNVLACSNYTRKSLQCQFKQYCIGPTFGVSQCSDSSNKEVCLNYNFECTWDVTLNKCIDFLNPSNLSCQQLEQNKTIVSSQVCYNSQIDEGACIYDAYTFTCEAIIPEKCEQLETKNQCVQISDLRCLWQDGNCISVIIKDSDTCENIGSNGSKQACLSIFRQGQQCQYINYECLAFLESIDEDNCLDNINKIACISQQSSLCYWKEQIKTVNNYSVLMAECKQFIPNSSQKCDSILSMQACFTISKPGQFCIWQSGECIDLPLNPLQPIFFNTFTLVNQNSCGLINIGKVRYSQLTRSCQLLENETITCKCKFETLGLNKQACLSIENEPCYWEDSIKKCLEYGSDCASN